MIVSWNWLKEYVDLDLSHDELVDRLTMSGLNHESTKKIGEDLAIDLEVTSNRPDCLGHLGVAREISVLQGSRLRVPHPQPEQSSNPVESLAAVEIQAPELCYRYTARVIRGVKVGPSPSWMAQRLQTLGIAVINNLADISNYVMMECGQPLHVFDYACLQGQKIIIRQAHPGETFQAIDHRTYQLDPQMCVIADQSRAVALGGVMGGVDSEVSAQTTDVLIEAADFAPRSIRSTARKLNLHSSASYRFERTVDPQGIDWASRRCCELILEIAGGTLAQGCIDVGSSPQPRNQIVLRFSQLKRILGIDVPAKRVGQILSDLGNEMQEQNDTQVSVIPPSWRRDLTREADLVEEVARIYGYDKIPEDAQVPMAASARNREDRVMSKIRQVLTAAGLDEAMTASLVPEKWAETFSPWTDSAPLQSQQPMLGVLEKSSQNIGKVDLLRRSLVPSLLEVRRINEFKSNPVIELFETAKVYLPTGDGLPDEPWKLAISSGRGFGELTGVVQSLIQHVDPNAQLQMAPCRHDLLDAVRSCELKLNGKRLGWLGELSSQAIKDFRLRQSTTVAELDLAVLVESAVLIAQHKPISPYPAMLRDLNFVVSEGVRWAELESTVRQVGGGLLEQVEFKEVFRNPEKDGPDKKRMLLTITLRSSNETLTGDQADRVCDQIISACQQNHAATLLA